MDSYLIFHDGQTKVTAILIISGYQFYSGEERKKRKITLPHNSNLLFTKPSHIMSETDVSLNELFQSFHSSLAGEELDIANIEIERLKRYNEKCQKQRDMVTKQLNEKVLLISKIQLKYKLVKAERDMLQREIISTNNSQEFSNKENIFYQFVPHRESKSSELGVKEYNDNSVSPHGPCATNIVLCDTNRSLGKVSCGFRIMKTIKCFLCFSRLEKINQKHTLQKWKTAFSRKNNLKYHRILDDCDSTTVESDDIIDTKGSNSSGSLVSELINFHQHHKSYVSELHDRIDIQKRTIDELRREIVRLVSMYISDPQTCTLDHNPKSTLSNHHDIRSEPCSF